MIKKYLDYLKDNPEGYWFKGKLYGWGWAPVTWQGWLVTLAFAVFAIWSGIQLEENAVGGEPTEEALVGFFIKLALAVLLLLVICWRTGEPPKWRWGLDKEEKKP